MKKDFIINCLYYFLICFLIFVFSKYIFIKILPLCIGVIIAIILRTVSTFLQKSLNLGVFTANIISICTFYAIIFTFFTVFLTNLTFDIKELYFKLSPTYQNFSNYDFAKWQSQFSYFFINPTFKSYFLHALEFFSSQIASLCANFSLFIAKILSNIVKTLPNIFLNLVLVILSSIFFLIEYDFFQKLLSNPRFAIVIQIKNSFFSTLNTLIFSSFVIFTINTALLTVGFLLIGIENSLKFALFVSLFDTLPCVGIGFILIPYLVFEFFIGNTLKSFNLLILYTVCVIIRNIVEPKILSNKIGVSPLLTIICMILSAKILGVVGAIICPFILIIGKNFVEGRKI